MESRSVEQSRIWKDMDGSSQAPGLETVPERLETE
jgi:hypothetical protein